MTLEYTKEECRLSLTSEDYIRPLCGCDVANRVIKFCSIHKAAPDTAEALQELISFLIHDGLGTNVNLVPIINRGTKALRKAGVEI